tara:strand:+ start:828 stop:1121 length:294 start_codon:yes stop_codon:yes gene_type:complete
MEALLYTGFGISLFCLGLATGAILENRMLKIRVEAKTQSEEVVEEVKKIEPLLISLADQIKRDYVNHTPVIYSIQDPDITLELPKVQEETWLKNQEN